MDPENVSMIGFAVLLIGFILTLGGMLFLGQVYSCGLSIGTSCPADVTARFAWAFPLMIFGGYMILLGGLATVAGYMVKSILSSKNASPVKAPLGGSDAASRRITEISSSAGEASMTLAGFL